MDAKDISNKLLVVIAGPTGSGKTNIAIKLAQHYQTEIVIADSRQVYKELNIGVGKPTVDQLATVSHHLISHVSIHDHYSAGHYTTDALMIIYTLFAKHDVVILSGGTGLYIKSIIDGFDAMPDVPSDVTSKWTKLWESEGTAPLIESLKELDPDYLAVVDIDNYSRLIRAVAVSDFSGRPFSSFRKGEKSDRFFQVLPVVLDLSRKELYEKINQRVIDMIQQGWLLEAKQLYPFRNLQALQTVGYQELFEVIEEKLSLEEATEKIQQSTRRYAKRQLTWFRNQGAWNWISPENDNGIIRLIDERSSFTNHLDQ
ncbi:MAG TPA: tRNA (adenosine(37)-N6)-dimethylallyltransferase MiaA [Saprospiraceae bacterium]|nr:tRNA (adenosine(37)-N6)-dimethylallyltransferase MiaA [Saprospiraceae bacterium]